MESRAFFHAQVNHLRGAISAELDDAVGQGSEQYEQSINQQRAQFNAFSEHI